MKIRFGYIILFFALAVAGCAAYFSIIGLSQLFAGASVAVIIMATVLEISKIVATTALHNYWSKIAIGLKTYLVISVIVLMAITSTGIYGFLSNAYQQTANKLEIHDGELNVLAGKKTIIEKTVIDNQKVIDNKNKRVEQLSTLRTTQESRLDNAKNNLGRSNARNDIKISNDEIQKLNDDINELNQKNNILSDSINSYTIKMLTLTSNNELAGEIGPLKYLSQLTNQDMANIVNILILLFIFVFDPLAVALILIANKVLQIDNNVNHDAKNVVKTNKKLIDGEKLLNSVTSVINKKKDEVTVGEIKNTNEDVIVEDTNNIIEEVDENITQDNNEDINNQPKKNKITLEDIKEIKEQNRGYSVNVPTPKSNNVIQSIGSNKIIRDGNKDKVIYKRFT
jgi:hypothetical protein